MCVVLVDVAQRRPVGFGVAAVDVAGELFEFLAQLAVLVDAAARYRRDLQVGHAAFLLRVAAQVMLETVEAFGQALGIVQSINADGELAVLQALAQCTHGFVAGGSAGLTGDVCGVDADGKRGRAHAAAIGGLYPVRIDQAAAAE
ncbi:hypothetical protein D3C81_1689800 [compost metagenome]